jgi:two-component system, sensor histidine kinase LadS
MKRILPLAVLILSSFATRSQSIDLTGEDRIEVRGPIRHFRDTKGILTLENIRERQLPIQHERTLNYGFDHAAHWISFDVENKSSNEDWMLEVSFAPLDKVEFFMQNDTGWVSKIAGDQLPMSVRDVLYPHPVFVFKVPSGENRTLFLRVTSTSSVQVPLSIWKHNSFITKSVTAQVLNGLFYGAMMVMILYQLFLFISTRDRITLSYVLTLVAMMHVVAFFQGYSFLYLYPERPELNHIMAIVTGPVFLVFSTWLTRAFLDLKKNSPLLDKMLMTNMEIDVLFSIVMIIWFGKFSYSFHHYAILAHCVIALAAAGHCFYRKFRPAFFYLLSWVTLLIAAIIFSMSNLGIFPEYLNTNSSGLMVGCVLQMLLISFALGNRWNILTRENQLGKELEVRRGHEEKVRLENEVQLRVEEISQKTQKLEEVNRIKDKLFSVVSHDIKGPLTSLHLALSLTKSGTISQQEFQQLTKMLEVKFNQTTEFIENLLQWANLQLRGETFDPVPTDLSELIKSTLTLLEFERRNKMIVVENTVEAKQEVYGDLNMLKSVLRNLMTNAIKFTPPGGKVKIHAELSGRFVTISVSDTGVGIPERNQPLIFSLDIVTTPGTGQERGTGLGLVLCKEFVERNGGRIWFETQEDKGTTFYFTIPKSNPVV